MKSITLGALLILLSACQSKECKKTDIAFSDKINSQITYYASENKISREDAINRLMQIGIESNNFRKAM